MGRDLIFQNVDFTRPAASLASYGRFVRASIVRSISIPFMVYVGNPRRSMILCGVEVLTPLSHFEHHTRSSGIAAFQFGHSVQKKIRAKAGLAPRA